jgi:trans-aconitate 2-methyltransferase
VENLLLREGRAADNVLVADWDGARYEAVSDLQRTMAAESLAQIDLDGSERVLDVGCGDGYVTAQIATRLAGGSILGIDPSPRMIEAAQRRDTTARFRLGDVTTLPFAAEFDVVTSFNALHWVLDQIGAYRRIAAALRPGGRALVTFVCAGPRPSIEQIGMDVARDPAWAMEFDGFAAPFVHPDPDIFSATAATAGFEFLERAVLDKSWDFGSRDAFARWCTAGFSDWTTHLQPDSVPKFIDDVVGRYTELVGRTGVFEFYQLRAELRRAEHTP